MEFQAIDFTDENIRLRTLKQFAQGHTIVALLTIHPFLVCFSITSKLILCNLRDGFVMKVLNSGNLVQPSFFFKLLLITELGDCLALSFSQKQCTLTIILPAKRQGEPASGFKYG